MAGWASQPPTIVRPHSLSCSHILLYLPTLCRVDLLEVGVIPHQQPCIVPCLNYPHTFPKGHCVLHVDPPGSDSRQRLPHNRLQKANKSGAEQPTNLAACSAQHPPQQHVSALGLFWKCGLYAGVCLFKQRWKSGGLFNRCRSSGWHQALLSSLLGQHVCLHWLIVISCTEIQNELISARGG